MSIKKGLRYLLYGVCCYSGTVSANPVAEEVFTNIYTEGLWARDEAGQGTSGPGSTLQTTEQYREFLEKFLVERGVESVVDFGCGDWEFSQAIDWNGAKYTGYDVVAPIIEMNKEKYAQPNIDFIHADANEIELPPADLLICKDVLQHLPNEDVNSFLEQICKFKYCLITNDIDPQTFSSTNPQAQFGQYRYIDLTQAPFFLHGTKVFTFWGGPYLKQVLLIEFV
jgi:SAM-dependent methyltransferase